MNKRTVENYLCCLSDFEYPIFEYPSLGPITILEDDTGKDIVRKEKNKQEIYKECKNNYLEYKKEAYRNHLKIWGFTEDDTLESIELEEKKLKEIKKNKNMIDLKCYSNGRISNNSDLEIKKQEQELLKMILENFKLAVSIKEDITLDKIISPFDKRGILFIDNIINLENKFYEIIEIIREDISQEKYKSCYNNLNSVEKKIILRDSLIKFCTKLGIYSGVFCVYLKREDMEILLKDEINNMYVEFYIGSSKYRSLIKLID